MDLATSFETKNLVLDILGPVDDNPIGLKVELCGPNDEVPALADMKAKHAAEIKGHMKRGKLKAPDDMYERQGKELIAARCVKLTWSGDLNFNGDTPKASVEVMLDLFEKLPWLFQQVANEAADTGNFYTKSGKPS